MTVLVPDVNILVYAFRTDSPAHDVYRAWLNEAVATDHIGLADTIVSGFVRIVTHPRIFEDPAPAAAAVSFVRHLVDSPRTGWLPTGAAAWDAFEELTATDHAIRGNLVPDAYIAALCIANGARLATRDRGFARFPGLRWFDPGQ
ncbi:TA system VapC family ribonuclease toxin [Microbacterium panaciterrae]|uniref:Ribonuclease VapC n=1 Tax=Microbacterium panaciterrae TaxID=985759 RepID=A0ABP8PHT6_9MICO